MPLMDWFQLPPPPRRRPESAIIALLAGGTGSVVEPVAPVPVNRRGGRGKPLIRRTPNTLVPAESGMEPDPEARRQGRNWEIMTRIINSLLRTGALYTDSGDRNTWRIAASGTITDGGDVIGGKTGTFTDSF